MSEKALRWNYSADGKAQKMPMKRTGTCNNKTFFNTSIKSKYAPTCGCFLRFVYVYFFPRILGDMGPNMAFLESTDMKNVRDFEKIIVECIGHGQVLVQT